MHVVGLPTHRITGQPTALTPYLEDFIEKVDKHKERGWKNKPNKFHLNKGRQMGFTEIVLRIILYYCLHGYAGWKVGIIAATSGDLARNDLYRLQVMLHNIWECLVWESNANRIQLVNGTIIKAFPASKEGITGDTNYKCIFMDEAAKWNLVDDSAIFNSIEPIINSGAGDFFLVSTPLGPIKKFYKIHQDPKDFVKFVYDIWCAEGNLYTREEIQYMIDSSTLDPNQEYLCMFTYGQNAILGMVGSDIRDEECVEWDVAIENDHSEEWVDPRELVPDNFIPTPEQK